MRIRRCKGACLERPDIAFPDKAAVDASFARCMFARCMKVLLDSGVYHSLMRRMAEPPAHLAFVVHRRVR